MYDPVAYTYDAAVHCEPCAEARFGRNERGFIGEDDEDSEGNPVGIIPPWNDGGFESCDTCHGRICLGCGDVDREFEPGEPCWNCGEEEREEVS